MKKSQNSKKIIVIDILLMIILFAFDQLTKILTRTFLGDYHSIKIIPGVLEFQFLQNRGAMWGMLQGQRVLFILIAVVVFVIMSLLIAIIPRERKYYILDICFVMILAGALGNTYDRIANGYVTDFIYVSLINFPIFNIADIYITVATILLMILVIFYYSDEDLQFLNFFGSKK